MVKTSRARSKIRQWLNTQQKRTAEEIGRRLLEQELKKARLQLKAVLRSTEMKEILAADGLKRVEDLYSRIGFGKAPVKSVVRRLQGPEAVEKEEQGRLRKAVGKLLSIEGAAIRVHGEGDLLASIAQCCTPVPGEPIVGFVTRGRGISVHSEDCANVRNLLYHPEREIDVEWADPRGVVYPVVLRIETEDQPGVLARLTETISKNDANIKSFEAGSTGGGRAAIEVVVEVRDQRQLARLRETLEALPHVIQVTRQRGARRPGRRAGAREPGARPS
jgi:GTP pyrophosphokinase